MCHESTNLQESSSSEQVVEHHVSPQLKALISLKAIESAHRLHETIETDAIKLAQAGDAILRECLPPGALAAVQQFSSRSGQSVFLLRGAVGIAAPETPIGGLADDGLLKPHDIILAGAMHLSGMKPTAFEFENSGKIARNVVPNPTQRGRASSHGSDVDLFWHQDNCGQPFEGEQIPGCVLPAMPEQLAFIGMRNDERVSTRILLVDKVLRSLQPSTKAILSLPFYVIGAPDSVAADGFGSTRLDKVPLLRVEGGVDQLRYDPFLVSTKHPAALLANARLALALEAEKSAAIDVVVEAGDVMIIKNYRVLHMRVAFEPHEASQSRWLRRFYGCRR